MALYDDGELFIVLLNTWFQLVLWRLIQIHVTWLHLEQLYSIESHSTTSTNMATQLQQEGHGTK